MSNEPVRYCKINKNYEEKPGNTHSNEILAQILAGIKKDGINYYQTNVTLINHILLDHFIHIVQCSFSSFSSHMALIRPHKTHLHPYTLYIAKPNPDVAKVKLANRTKIETNLTRAE